MRQRLILILFLLVVGIAGLILLITAQKKAPKADVINAYPQLPAKSTATIWGKVILADNKQPAKNIKITLGSFSLVTDDNGNYLFTSAEVGELPISFEDNTTHQAYEVPNVVEQSVDIELGISRHLDFTIAKATQK